MRSRWWRGSAALAVVGAIALGACSGGSRPTRAAPGPATTRTVGPVTVTTVAPFAAPNCRRAPRTDSSDPASPVRFVDVTCEAGLALDPVPVNQTPRCLLTKAFLQSRFPAASFDDLDARYGGFCQIERFTGGAAVGDYDGDGDPDVYVPRLDGPGRLFRNDGRGRFTDVTRASGLAGLGDLSVGAAWADIDNDGDEDLAVSTFGAPRYYLFVNDGRGRFTEQAVARGTAAADGTMHFGFSIAVGDYDGDGFVDLYFTEYRGRQGDLPVRGSDSRLFRNRGRARPGYFEDTTARAGLASSSRDAVFSFAATLRDFDGDGRPDLWVTGDFGTSRLWWNQGDGTFRDGTAAARVGTEENGMGAATGDIDGDGRPDRFVTSVFDPRGSSLTRGGNWGGSGNRVFRNVGRRRFVDVTDRVGLRDGQWGWGAAFIDATNRGRLDVVQVSGIDYLYGALSEPYLVGPSRYWVAGRGGSYDDRARSVGIAVTNGRGVALFDYDGDGRLDVFIVRGGGSPLLYRNESPAHGHWLRVKVRGTASNRDGLGAVVTVTTPSGRRSVQEIQSATDFLGQSERVAHVGLGGDTGPVRVEVRFPATGRRVVLRSVAVDRVLDVAEPPA